MQQINNNASEDCIYWIHFNVLYCAGGWFFSLCFCMETRNQTWTVALPFLTRCKCFRFFVPFMSVLVSSHCFCCCLLQKFCKNTNIQKRLKRQGFVSIESEQSRPTGSWRYYIVRFASMPHIFSFVVFGRHFLNSQTLKSFYSLEIHTTPPLRV